MKRTAAVLALVLASACAQPTRTLRKPTTRQRLHLAGETMRCAGEAQQRAVLFGLGAAGASLAGSAGVAAGSAVALNSGYPVIEDRALVAGALVVAGGGAIVASAGLAAASLFSMWRGAEYHAMAGAVLDDTSSAGGCE